MQAFGILCAAVLGACLGSFANVVVVRLHEEMSLWGRSRCPSCKVMLHPRHLVPILSWIFLGGRCATCRTQIHIQYPIVEVISTAATALIAFRFPPFQLVLLPWFLFTTFMFFGLLIMMVMDLRWQELPLEGMLMFGFIGFAWRIVMALTGHGSSLLMELVMTAVVSAGAITFFGLQWLVSKGRWLGSGDVWFGFMMALILGWPGTALAIYLAYLIGGLLVMLLMALGYVKRGMRVAFGPALGLGTLLVLWFEPLLIDAVRALLLLS